MGNSFLIGFENQSSQAGVGSLPELNAAVASVTNVTSFRTRRRLRRRISARCRTWRDSNHSKCCYAASWGIACSTNRKNRVLRVPDLSLPVSTETVSDNVCMFVVKFSDTCKKFPVLRNIFPVNSRRELRDKSLQDSGFLQRNQVPGPQNYKTPCKIP